MKTAHCDCCKDWTTHRIEWNDDVWGETATCIICRRVRAATSVKFRIVTLVEIDSDGIATKTYTETPLGKADSYSTASLNRRFKR